MHPLFNFKEKKNSIFCLILNTSPTQCIPTFVFLYILELDILISFYLLLHIRIPPIKWPYILDYSTIALPFLTKIPLFLNK